MELPKFDNGYTAMVAYNVVGSIIACCSSMLRQQGVYTYVTPVPAAG